MFVTVADPLINFLVKPVIKHLLLLIVVSHYKVEYIAIANLLYHWLVSDSLNPLIDLIFLNFPIVFE